MNLRPLLALVLVHLAIHSNGQTASKITREHFQTWTSFNSVFRFGPKWGLQADVHVRRTNGIADPSFYFARIGGMYWAKENVVLAAGYGHLWAAPQSKNFSTWGHENRIHQQLVYTGKAGKVNIAHRLRNEQRWQQVIVNDVFTGKVRFSDRVRYQFGVNIPIFKDPRLPQLTMADELMVQFGKNIVYNTFDQNRIFIGLRQNITQKLSFDIGYMNVYQQRYAGNVYDMNHTLRLFFFYTGGRRESRHHAEADE